MTARKILGTTDDQSAIRASLLDVLDRREVRPMPASACVSPDLGLWSEICQGLALGDLAATDPDLSISPTALMATCFEELGARLAPVPALSTFAFAAPAVLACRGVADAGAWWPDLQAGRCIAAVARPTDDFLVGDLDGRLTLSGTAPHTVDGASADVLLAIANTVNGSTCLVEVDTSDPDRVQRRREPTFDLTRELAWITLRDAPVRLIGSPDPGPNLRTTLTSRANTLLAAEQLGGLSACLDLAVEHAKTRFQFGRSVGSFQVIKHRLADMYFAMELARSAVAESCRAIDEQSPDAELWSTIAHHIASTNFARIAGQTLQIHGGLGFTWEHPTHLFLKRAKASEVLVSLPSERTTKIARLLGI